MTSAILIEDVHKHYGSVQALKGMSLDIKQGEFFGLLGPNGAGKSTLIGIIAGLTRMDSGHVSVMGHDVVHQYRQSRQCLGVVPQELVFDPFFSVREILEIQAGYFGKDKRIVGPWIDQLLEGLKLTDKANANMRALSGGMKRRVLIAQALVHKPEVVILDEPTAGVDVELRSSLWEFVTELHKQGHTIVLTTHYLEEAETLCDRIGIVNQGSLVALDDKQALLQRGVGGRCALHVVLQQAIKGLSIEGVEINQSSDIEITIQFDKRKHPVMSVLDALRAQDAKICDIRVEEPDLEDVFIELTRQ